MITMMMKVLHLNEAQVRPCERHRVWVIGSVKEEVSA